jgi:hypothetical protein
VGDTRQPRSRRQVTAKPRRALPQTRRGLTASSIVFASVLVLIAATSFWVLINYRSLQLPAVASLALTAALTAGVFVWFFMPSGVGERTKRSLGAGVSIMTLVIGLLAIPEGDSGHAEPPPGAPSTATQPGAPSTATATPFKDREPLYVTLGRVNECESFVVDNKLLPSIPASKKLNAKWIYDNGGSHLKSAAGITLQGGSYSPTIVMGLRPADLQSRPAPKDVSVLNTCPRPKPRKKGDQDLCSRPKVRCSKTPKRYLTVFLDPQRALAASSGDVKYDQQFPYEVDRTDIEYFHLTFKSSSSCICTFKLALDWKSFGRPGTEIVEPKLGSFRMYISDRKLRTFYLNNDGTWDPALPK